MFSFQLRNNALGDDLDLYMESEQRLSLLQRARMKLTPKWGHKIEDWQLLKMVRNIAAHDDDGHEPFSILYRSLERFIDLYYTKPGSYHE